MKKAIEVKTGLSTTDCQLTELQVRVNDLDRKMRQATCEHKGIQLVLCSTGCVHSIQCACCGHHMLAHSNWHMDRLVSKLHKKIMGKVAK